MTTFATALAQRESRVVRVVRRAAVAAGCLYAVSFAWSICRRLRQILYIEARVSSHVLTPGSAVGYDVIASGEVPNRIRLELVQDERRAVLLEQRAHVNRIRSIDPRVFRYAPTVPITSALLARFPPGPATLRVTGFGGQKLLLTPAPQLRELQVRLRP